MKPFLLPFLLFSSLAASAQTPLSITGANEAIRTARPGDTLFIADGEYRDAELNLVAQGDPARPIVVRAVTAGRVLLTGNSSLRLAGSGIEVSGLYFTRGFCTRGAAIEFRSGKEVANGCRITQCAIDDFNPPARETESSWILMYGRNNRFDHNSVAGKLNQGVTFAVILDGERNQENNHRIDSNYFGSRPPLGANGGETIRVGTSQSSLSSSRTVIENNFFQDCDGEVEIVSIKSCDNIIRGNTFFESSGVLALRHGHRNLVANNAFIGNGKPNTGGVRVINEGHTIRDNYFSGLTGQRFFAPLAIMNAVPNSLPNRYHQVKDVRITGNSWVDCAPVQFHVGKDNERTLAPENVTLANNFFYNRNSDTVYTALDKLEGFHFADNRVVTRSGHFTQRGFAEVRVNKPENRTGAVGKESCGATWYVPATTPVRRLSGRVLEVKAGQNTIAAALQRASFGDALHLTDTGTYLFDASAVINTYVRIESKLPDAKKALLRYNGNKGKVALLSLTDGAVLEVAGLSFDNDAFEERASAAAAIAPVTPMKGHYSVYADGCDFYNYTESSFSALRAQRNTYADTIRFTNCQFRDMSGDAIYLAAEKDDAGKYSADFVEIRNCVFYRVLGHSVDLYRGGSDESTSGPTLLMDHCVLEDVNNKERGAGLRLLGVQNIDVRNTLFSNTGRGGASIKLDETNWDKIRITNCNLYQSGRVASFWGKAVTGPMYRLKPVYKNTAGFDFSSAKSSPLLGKATDGGSIGLQGTL
ncbi:MAG: hypothetical protein EOO15_08150 [Chitinophagaceae bacterium]|nr:MAG: hypothetical protein EOO15_08150 [Chitinophagaceae bacterium]